MNNIMLDAVQQTANAIKSNPEAAVKKFFAGVIWQDGVRNHMTIREFQPILIDEPQPLGGTDRAPNPVEYLLGAAVSCFAITFEVLASQNGILLEKVEADIEADLDAAVFLGIKEGYGGIQNPVIKLKAVTNASEEQVRQIANLALVKSPVLLSLGVELKLVM